MDKSQFEIAPNVWADCRRALFFEKESIVAVADLHLGYAWAHRYNGQMMPIDNGHPGIKLLEQIVGEFRAKKLVVLGDIVHQAVPVPQVKGELEALLALNHVVELVLLSGNHDKQLQKFIPKEGKVQLFQEYAASPFNFLHGDRAPNSICNEQVCVIGHEHPAISLGDGVATSAKFPCFLVSDHLIVLPAFSPWAAGSRLGAHPFMSPLARTAKFHTALAVMGKRLLPIPLNK